MLKTIENLEVAGKKVLVRCDFNVPLKDGVIQDDTRITEALPTIKKLLKKGAAVILVSHLGRPEGKRVDEYSLRPVADRLSELLGISVWFAEEVLGDETSRLASSLEPGDVLLLENLRFYPGEKNNDSEFAKSLASLADLFVQDAFGTVHREHASMVGVAELLPSAAGMLLEKEIKYLSMGLDPEHPLVVCLGGAKLETKIPVIEKMLEKADIILIGGGMAYTLLKAGGKEIGKSLLDENNISTAQMILSKAREYNVDLDMPTDHVAAASLDDPNSVEITEVDIPKDLMGVDIGLETRERYAKKIQGARTIVINGPMGVFEVENFSKGTKSVLQAIVEATSNGASSIAGGGDTVSAIKNLGIDTKGFTHISTGGGASLKFLEGKELPGIKVLDN
ncbi:MAG: phosphoglycerate kinase [Elusimicrobiota bacterium]